MILQRFLVLNFYLLNELIIVHETLGLWVRHSGHHELSGPVHHGRFKSSNLDTKEVQNVLFDTVIKWRLVVSPTN